jgi:Homeodomain-like domain
MFLGTGKPRKPEQRARARDLRSEGWSYKRIAAELEVSPSSAFNWTRDIELTPEQMERLIRGPGGPQNPEHVASRAAAIRAAALARRRAWQEAGRAAARQSDPLHLAGCMLYWAEGSKNRNCAKLSNSQVPMLAYFRRFLAECFETDETRFAFSLHVYLGNGMSIEEIEGHWLDALGLPRACLRKHSINPLPTSSSGSKTNRLPYGVGNLSYCSTQIVQHIFGAIQEYAGFEEPRWLG